MWLRERINLKSGTGKVKMKHLFGAIAVVVSLSACSQKEMEEMDASDAMYDKAENYCGVTMGLSGDPKTFDQCKQHYVQGMMDAKKSK